MIWNSPKMKCFRSEFLIDFFSGDTHLLSTYFEIIHRRHVINTSNGDVFDKTLYMPPIIFDRNAHQVPRLVRMADLMWCGAGLSCFQTVSRKDTVAIPTSVYTLTLPVVDLVKGWDTGPEAIGEDMHMMIKSYFLMNGKLNIECVPSQALRHMWGCLDTGFAVQNWSQLGKSQESRTKDLTSPRSISLEWKFSQFKLQTERGYRVTWRNFDLLTRVFEAHFLPVHIFLVMLTSTLYTSLETPTVSCQWLSFSLNLMGYMRAFGFITMIFYFAVCYERYHRICVEARISRLRHAGLYRDMEDQISRRRQWHLLTWVDYFMFPISGCIYGSVPLLQAAFSHFWTVDLFYKVSAKPKRIFAEETV